MAIKIKRLVGRPSKMQRLLQVALTGVANDLISWQKTNKRSATGRSQNWLITFKRFGNNKPKDIVANLIGVSYINYALFGRGKGKRPTWQIIAKWMRVRGISGRDVQSGRFRTRIEAAKAIAVDIGRFGTGALRLSTVLIDAFYARNISKAIDQVLPDITAETAEGLADDFVDSTKGLNNFQVTTKTL